MIHPITCGVKYFDGLIIQVYRRSGRRGAAGIEEDINVPKKEGWRGGCENHAKGGDGEW